MSCGEPTISTQRPTRSWTTKRSWLMSAEKPASPPPPDDVFDDGAAAFNASQGVAVTAQTIAEVKSIMPVSWMGPDVFHVTSTGEAAVLLRLDHRGWHACSSKEEVFDGGAIVAGASVDLLEAAAKA